MPRFKTIHPGRPLQLGFIGGGLSSAIGPAHFSACRLDGRWELVAGSFSRSVEINLATAEAWHISKDRVYQSWQGMVTDEIEKLDAVAILTPPLNHAEIILELLKRGIPIICEKPLVSSLEDAIAIKRESKVSRGFLSVTYNYSGYPMVRELRERVQNGELGRIQKVHLEMPQEGFSRVDPVTGQSTIPQSWRLKDGNIPTICHDLGAHLHHLGYFITGKHVQKTTGKFSSHSIYENVVDDIMMWLEYEDGVKGSFWMSKTALGHRNGLRIRIYGTNGSAEWLQSRPEEMCISGKDGSKTVLDRAARTMLCGESRYNRYRPGHPSGFIEAFANLYFDMADAVTSYSSTGVQENPYVFGIDHSIKCLELFTAARKADETVKWVDVNDVVVRGTA